MALLVQQELQIPTAFRDQFEVHGRTRRWPALLHFGAQMVAYGRWEFGGRGDLIVTNTAYADFDHWEACRPGGALSCDDAMLQEVGDLVDEQTDVKVERPEVVRRTRVFDLDTGVSWPQPYMRLAGQRLPDQPPSFGVGSVISERTLTIQPGKREEFVRASREVIWPWLESQGGRAIGMGNPLMGASNELTTWFAFRSLSEWYRFARPSTANAPAEVAKAFSERQNAVSSQRGRILVVETNWGVSEGTAPGGSSAGGARA